MSMTRRGAPKKFHLAQLPSADSSRMSDHDISNTSLLATTTAELVFGDIPHRPSIVSRLSEKDYNAS